MSWYGVAITVHILGIVWWIGGLAFATLVFLPLLRSDLSSDPFTRIRAIEHRFAPQARIALTLVGLSGAYMLSVSGLWRALLYPAAWWLDLMILYWAFFALLLFVLEPTGIMKRIVFSGIDTERGFNRFHTIHKVLLAAGIVVIASAAISSHG